jgi:plasmid stabilization system protein ParE
MKLEWSAAALADLDRFAAFLQNRHPRLAGITAAEIQRKAQILSEHPLVGRAIQGRPNIVSLYLMWRMPNGLSLCVDGGRLVMLRVFHTREQRE